MTKANAVEGVTIKIANAIFASPGTLPQFQSDLQTKFQADVSEETSHDVINNWVAQKTNDKIKDLLESGGKAVAPIIVNAVYFKGTWKNEFDSKKTLPGQNFYKLDGSVQSNSVNMMTSTGQEFYLKHDHFQMVLKPYKGEDVAAVFVLPKKLGKAGLSAARTAFEQYCHDDQRFPLGERKIDLAVPKFKMKEDLCLNETLKKMGVRDAWQNGVADFTKMLPGLYIADVIHAATVEVNEAGAEAAAATFVEQNLANKIFGYEARCEGKFWYYDPKN